ncbi:MAG: DUF2946 family protein [Proteobacteria bacterium]|nr:DUF2946 family protein [Pseudomonadota bacterium]HQR03134.1 DUF2946 family protein [Rhodocyclaceae bacterium]
MDDAVRAALTRWPNVPAVFGWLSLDRRGIWRLRGDPIRHVGTREFIQRNYAADEQGRWYFQNGPQRVYVTLEVAPWVLRIRPDHNLETHAGQCVDRVEAAWLDSDGHLILVTPCGPGVMDDRDLPALLDALTDIQGRVFDESALLSALAGAGPALQLTLCGHTLPLRTIAAADLPAQLGFIRSPQPQ